MEELEMDEKQVQIKTEKKFFTVKEFYSEIGGVITKSQIYRLIKQGDIPKRRIGSKLVLSAQWVSDFINAPFSDERKGA